MGNERKYIRNLALSLMGELKVDQEIFSRWEVFPPVITPPKALDMHCGDKVSRKLIHMSVQTLGRIVAFGRKDYAPHFPNQGTTLHDVMGDTPLNTREWGGVILLNLARATIVAEMVDILFERLTPEQRVRFEDDGDDGIEPSSGRSVRLDALGAD